MKKKIYIIGIFVLVIILIVGSYVVFSKNNNNTIDDGKIKVIATLFPQYDFVKQIGKDKVSVTLLLPPGVESHVYEPKPSDIVKIHSSDMFVYTGKDMEPWADTILQSVEKINVVDVSKNVQLQKEVHDEDEPENSNEPEYDPHIWLNPSNAKVMVDNVVEGLINMDPSNSDFYKQNGEEYKKEIDKLDKDIQAVVDNGKRKKIVFGGRFAFAYFIQKYNLDYVAAYDSCSTETEPSVSVISKVISSVKENNIPVVFYEEFSAHTVADSIANQSGAQTLLFHSVHNVSREELSSGITYIDLMRQNLNNLKIALN